MSYTNPLHPPVTTSRVSPYTAIGGAVRPSANRNAGHSESPSSHRRRLPQPTYTPSSKWRQATGRSAPLHAPITFDYVGHARQGVPMRELSTRGSHALDAMIHGAGDLIFASSGLARVTLRIIWPGYEHIEWVRSIELNTNGPMTRVQLGATVSMNFARFMEKSRTETSKSPEWEISLSKIRFEHLILVSFRNVFEDVWQADVAVDRCS